MRRTIAVDIGGTFIKYGIVDAEHRILTHSKVPTGEHADRAAFFDYICANMPVDRQADRIGISVPGLIDREGYVRSYAAPRLQVIFASNIREEIGQRTGLPAAAINDGKAAGLCELKLGNGRGSSLSAYLIIGTGGGGCICTKDDVFGGIDNFAGEFHFMAYPDERNGETVKTGRAIGTFGLIKRYNERVEKEREVMLGKEITDRCFDGEALAEELVKDWIHRIALQCLTIIVALNPEILCIGGGISAEDWFIDSVKREYEKVCNEHFAGIQFLTTRLERCKYLNDANLLGAALCAEKM